MDLIKAILIPVLLGLGLWVIGLSQEGRVKSWAKRHPEGSLGLGFLLIIVAAVSAVLPKLEFGITQVILPIPIPDFFTYKVGLPEGRVSILTSTFISSLIIVASAGIDISFYGLLSRYEKIYKDDRDVRTKRYIYSNQFTLIIVAGSFLIYKATIPNYWTEPIQVLLAKFVAVLIYLVIVVTFYFEFHSIVVKGKDTGHKTELRFFLQTILGMATLVLFINRTRISNLALKSVQTVLLI